MKKKLPIILAAVGIIAVAASAIGSTRAALAYYSDDYIAQVDVKSIGVTLMENNNEISWRDYLHKDDSWYEAKGTLLSNLLKDSGDEEIVLNKEYKEELSVLNSGTIDEYVRVEVSKYWMDEDQTTKRTDLDPSSIVINFTNDGWVEDKSSATTERNVFYYTDILKSGATSSLFADKIMISGDIAKKVTETSSVDSEGYTTIVTTYDYDGLSFVVEASVDAVQTHNAKEAIKSAWGLDVTIADDGGLSLN